jgi:puromycin-sensitive aminopeptidase
VGQVRELFMPQLERLGWDPRPDEGDLTGQLRAIIVTTLGLVADDQEVAAEAIRRFEADEVHGDLARAILRVVAHQNRPGDYERFLERYRHPSTPQEEQRYMIGFGDFDDPAVARDLVERCFGEFRNQDAPLILGLLSANAVTGPAAWRSLSERWDEALATFPSSLMVRTTIGLPTYIKDPDFADTVEAFHRAHPIGGDQRTVEQYLERMRVGLRFAAALREQF